MNAQDIKTVKQRFINFHSGLRMRIGASPHERILLPKKWTAPDYVDGRPLLMAADDQMQTPKCTAYGMTAVCEALRWWATGVKQSYDADLFYDVEKRIDNDNQEGSSLETAIKAAQTLKWLTFKNPEGLTVTVDVYDIRTINELKYAFHRCPVVLFGFNITQAWMRPRADGTIADSNKFVGGHCVAGDLFDPYGVDNCNSWGLGYGFKGHVKLSWKQVQQQMMGAKGFLLRVS